MNPFRDGRGRPPILRDVVAPLLILLGCVASLVPLSPRMPGATLDEGWMFGINAAVAAGLRFGSEVAFTYGPYAAAYTHVYHPATDAMMLGSTLWLAAAVGAALTALTVGRHRWAAVGFACALSQLPAYRDAAFLVAPLLFLALAAHVSDKDRPRRAGAVVSLLLLAPTLAVLPLIKGSLTLGAAVAAGLGCALLAWRSRWGLALLLPLASCATLPLAWIASGQALPDLPGFFVAQGRIIDGYTEAMSSWQLDLQPLFFLAAAALVLVLHLPGQLRRGAPGRVLLLGTAALLFLVFKGGFVRQDGAHVPAAANLLGLSAWILFLGRPGLRPALALAAGLGGWVVLEGSTEPLSPSIVLERSAWVAAAAASGAVQRLDGGNALRREYDARLAAIRAEHPLPQAIGTADIYSVGQSALLAHGIPWSPRPVLQSYSAYSGALAQANAGHLLGPRAPDTVFFAAEPIDGRMAAQEDGASWPVLLTRYEAVGRQGQLAVLRRRTGPVGEARFGAPLLQQSFTSGDAVPLPADQGPLWATIRVQPTGLGRLATFLFRPPVLMVAFQMRDGREEYRYLSRVGEAGFLISPVVGDTDGFLALATPGAAPQAGRVPASFTLDTTRWGGGFWQDRFHVELRPLVMPPPAGSRAP